MFETLLVLHFIGFIMGFGGGIGNAVSDAKLSGLPPENAKTVGAFYMTMGKISTIGLILLWITGLWMVNNSYGTAIFSDPVFAIKIAAVVGMTILSIMINLAVARARKAGGAPPERIKTLGKYISILGLTALILAVVKFA